MASSERWALYATNRRIGTTREHRLAGARLGPFAALIDYDVPRGWRFSVHVRPFHVEVGKAVSEEMKRRYFEEVIERWPDFNRDIEAGEEDFKAGRGYRMNLEDPEAPMEPLAAWSPDDPRQPEGWHHDGDKWVLDDVGWARDRGGYWRYTKPGDFGWVFRDDRWEYLDKNRQPRRVRP